MRVIIILAAVTVATALAGYALRPVDRIASWLLFGFSAVTGLVLAGAFFGWIDI